MKKLLISGFDPFGGEAINPSYEAVKLLPKVIGEYELTKIELPTVFGRAAEIMIEKIEEIRPDAVICVGQAGGRAGVTPEFVAINVADAASPDNAGVLRSGETLVDGTPDAYFATIPVRKMVEALKAAEIPSALSYTAGAYVCNCVMYHALHNAKAGQTAGFVHVPFSTAQSAKRNTPAPSLPPEMIAKAVEICVRTAIVDRMENNG